MQNETIKPARRHQQDCTKWNEMKSVFTQTHLQPRHKFVILHILWTFKRSLICIDLKMSYTQIKLIRFLRTFPQCLLYLTSMLWHWHDVAERTQVFKSSLCSSEAGVKVPGLLGCCEQYTWQDMCGVSWKQGSEKVLKMSVCIKVETSVWDDSSLI